jgi:hypothetical protein
MKPHFVPAIEKPCPMKWESMIGNEKRRYCERCQLHVHNLSAMTISERTEVLAPSSEHKCISYLTRADANAPQGKVRLKLQSLSWLPHWLAAIVAIFSSSCVQRYTGAPPPPPPSNSAKNPHTETAP